ncbi:MAG: ATP-binding cassette domain-containing protein [Acutalibacteraceae bacterium]
MLQLKKIKKQYRTNDLVQTALDGINLNLRDNEFVAILGPSGSGKTTLLNIVGGLDRYDEGDLIINEISTKQYKDKDWDSYRNHTIGFVFQSYNLIPHQTVLSNVELALTISGVSKSERKKRAKEALEKVGLGNQLHKKPNQMSGGQMQRVAIARALVNNPDILLADEPTGALDSETSIQIMDLLKEVAKDRLVVMVTHNPELAEQYATRIVKLRDGKIIGDTNPFEPDSKKTPKPEHKNMGKASMSFLTSLSLSFNNLRTKKGRTLLTSFAGSIGIIGIALILALSTGVNAYISDIQKDTMTSYPIQITEKSIDLNSIISTRDDMIDSMTKETENRDGVYANNTALELSNSLNSSVTENNLTAFKKYLDDPKSEINKHIGSNGIVYSYNVNFNVFAEDSDGNVINTDVDVNEESSSSSNPFESSAAMMKNMKSMFDSSNAAKNFEELIPDADGKSISHVITDNYEVLYGNFPEKYDEVVLVLNKRNEIPTSILYQLGFITKDEYDKIKDDLADGKEAEIPSWNYKDICEKEFSLVPACDCYIKNSDGTFKYIGDDIAYQQQILDNSIKLKITGVIRPKENANTTALDSTVAYTNKLTNYLIDYTNKSEIVKAQEETPETNVLNGLPFKADDDKTKIENAKEYISSLSTSGKASLYTMILYNSKKQNAETPNSTAAENQAANNATANNQTANGTTPNGQAANTTNGTIPNNQNANTSYGTGSNAQSMDEKTLAAAMDKWLKETPDNDFLLSIYDKYISGSDYNDNLDKFGKVSYDAPSAINIYADSFEDKDEISNCIEKYNDKATEENKITYTDYIALMISSVTSIVDIISYVLIAFVSVSLVVSCIMIGIITHISVMERTKEIGILRAIGASKHNISQVFNAETLIIGLCSGILGVGISELLLIPINAIIHALVGSATVNAVLSLPAAVILIAISTIITLIGGLLPAKKAAKKDPVIALRTE